MSLSDLDNAPIARLGPFDLIGYLGRGAMGQVWRARHREQDVAAAIKIITEEQAQFEDYQRQFRHEVRAAAGLSHPGVVMVFDYGSVTAEVEEATFGELRANNPYLAMELCPKGSLQNLKRGLSFTEVRSILLSLLDALAHAHARGVIHRDLKPANILMGDATDWTGVKLTDFGLAFLQERFEGDDTSRRGACGTPAYMPPEQLLGKWRDVGPWSDLYSLGCLAYQLVCGQAPYPGTSIVEVAKKHLRTPIPALTPQIAVPEELEGWVRRLLQKEKHARFRNAADAAWELLLMSAPAESQRASSSNGDFGKRRSVDFVDPNFNQQASTFALKYFDNLLDSTMQEERLVESQSPAEGGASQTSSKSQTPDRAPGQSPAPSRAPLPSTWHHLIGRRPSVQLLGAGLGLYGLRHVPLIGRESEREVLWTELRHVVQETTPRSVMLRGAAGTGKSYLAEWLGERAQETGAALCLKATHSPGPGGGEGLVRMLARFFRTAGMKRAEILARLRDWFVTRNDLDPYAWDALTEFLEPATDDDLAQGQRKIHFGSAVQRYSLLVRVLRLISQERAVVVWLDDLQWASDSLDFLKYVLGSEACEDLPVLFVATVREDALVDESSARSELAGFALDDKVEHLTLEPLPTQTQAELIEKLLYLAPSLARRVADRTGGNPLFAVQLIGDWVDRGVLQVDDQGFVLADGEEALIPDDLFDVWSSRLTEVLSDATEAQIRALELAAVLGLEVDEAEWRACLALNDREIPSHVVQKLLSHRLLEDTDTGVRFVHGMLRESLERRAKEAGRFIEHNRVCARMLEERYTSERHLAERLGRHLLAARAYQDALDPLLEGARARGNGGEIDAALVLLDLRLDAIDALALPEHCIARVESWLQRAFAIALRGEHDAADALATRAISASQKIGEPCLIARCFVRHAQIRQQQNRHESSSALLEQARELAVEACCGDDILMAIEETAGVTSRATGDIEAAIEHLQEARQLAVASGAVTKAIAASRELGSCERRLGNLDKAEHMLREALVLCEDSGLQLRIGDTLLSLADVVRLRGRLDEAEDLYRQAFHSVQSTRPLVATVAQLNLALLYVQRESYDETRLLIDKLRPRLTNAKLQFYADAISLPCLAVEASWTSFEAQSDHVLESIERRDVVDDDVAICLHQAAKIAAQAGQDELARRIFDTCLLQWEQLGNTEKARATRQQLDRIVAPTE